MKDKGNTAATAEGAALRPETPKDEPAVTHNDGVPTTRDRLMTQFQSSAGRQTDPSSWTSRGRLVQSLAGRP